MIYDFYLFFKKFQPKKKSHKKKKLQYQTVLSHDGSGIGASLAAVTAMIRPSVPWERKSERW